MRQGWRFMVETELTTRTTAVVVAGAVTRLVARLVVGQAGSLAVVPVSAGMARSRPQLGAVARSRLYGNGPIFEIRRCDECLTT